MCSTVCNIKASLVLCPQSVIHRQYALLVSWITNLFGYLLPCGLLMDTWKWYRRHQWQWHQLGKRLQDTEKAWELSRRHRWWYQTDTRWRPWVIIIFTCIMCIITLLYSILYRIQFLSVLDLGVQLFIRLCRMAFYWGNENGWAIWEIAGNRLV